MKRFLYFILGIILCSVSFSIVIIYFNLLVLGFSFGEFLITLLKCFEFYFFIPGILLIKKDRF